MSTYQRSLEGQCTSCRDGNHEHDLDDHLDGCECEIPSPAVRRAALLTVQRRDLEDELRTDALNRLYAAATDLHLAYMGDTDRAELPDRLRLCIDRVIDAEMRVMDLDARADERRRVELEVVGGR